MNDVLKKREGYFKLLRRKKVVYSGVGRVGSGIFSSGFLLVSIGNRGSYLPTWEIRKLRNLREEAQIWLHPENQEEIIFRLGSAPIPEPRLSPSLSKEAKTSWMWARSHYLNILRQKGVSTAGVERALGLRNQYLYSQVRIQENLTPERVLLLRELRVAAGISDCDIQDETELFGPIATIEARAKGPW